MRSRTTYFEPCTDCGSYDRGNWLACQWAEQNPEQTAAGHKPPCIDGSSANSIIIAALIGVALILIIIGATGGVL